MRSEKALKRRFLLAAAVASLGIPLPAFAANTELDVLNGASDLTAAASYSQNTAPTSTSDVTFLSGLTYNPTTFLIGSNLTIGTLNDLDATQALTISNTGATDATLTLSGGSNSISGANASDVLYVASGANLSILNGPTNLLNVALGATGNFDIAGTATIGSTISGAFGFTKTGSGTLTLSGSNTYTGTTTINVGTLLATGTSGGTPFGTGSLALNAGTLSILAPAAAGTDVAYTAATASGATFTYGPGAKLVLNANGNSSLTFTVGSGTGTVLSRATGGTLVIAPTSGIANLGIGSGGENFVVNGTAPALTNSMVSPSILAQASSTDTTGTFLTYGASGFAAFAGYTAESANYSPSANEISDITATPVTVTPGANNPYAIRVGSGNTLTIGSGTLTVTSGGIILNGGTIAGSTLGFGTAEGLLYSSSSGGLIESVISGSGGITVFGPGKLTLGATATTTIANTFSGAININGGTLAAVITQLNNATATSPIGTNAGHVITLNGGTFEILAGSANVNPQSGTSSFVIGAAGGTFVIDAGGLQLDDAGQLVDSSGGSITKAGTAQWVLGNATTAYTITGPMFVNAGSLKLINNGANALGSTPLVTVASGAELDSDGLTVARPLALNGTGLTASVHGALTNSSGNLATINGAVTLASNASIGGSGAGGIKINGSIGGPGTLTKIDGANLTLTGANTYSGGTTLTTGTLTLSNAAGSATGTGNITLNPAGGVTLASGAAGAASGTLIGATAGTNTFIAPGGHYTLGTLSTFGTLTLGGLTLTSNATALPFDLSTTTGSNDQLVVTGLDALTHTGANAVPVTFGQAPVGAGTYHLIEFNQDGSGTIGLGTFSLPTGNGRLSYSYAISTVSGTQQSLDLTVSGSTTPITANFVSTTPNTSWQTGANWSTTPLVPGLPGDTVTFNNGASIPTPLQVTLDGQQHVASLTFNNTGTQAFTIATGANTGVTPALVIDNGASPASLTNSTNSNTISAPIVFASPTTITVSGTTAGIPNMLTLGGALSGTSALTINTTTPGDILLLSGANGSLSSAITVGTGGIAIQAGSTTALGTGAVSIGSGSTLDLNGKSLTGGTITLTGTGVGGNGALVNSSTTAAPTITNPVAISGATSIGGSNNFTLNGIVSGSGVLTKIGPSNITFAQNANTDTGAIVINAGTLTLSGTNNASGTVQAPSITVNSGATLVLTNGDTLGFTANRNALFINSGGAVFNNTSGKRDTIATVVTMVGGTLGGSSTGDTTSTGAYSMGSTAGAITATSDAFGNPATVSANISLQATTNIFTANRGPAVTGLAPDLLVSGPVTNYSTTTTNVLVKTGTGIMTLTGANTYTGPTNVNLGTMVLNNTAGTVLGGTAITVGNGAAITSSAGNATLLVQGNNKIGTATAGSITISGGDGTTTGQGTLSLVDGAINSLTFTNRTTAATDFTIGSATAAGVLSFELGTASGSNDAISLGNNNLQVNAGGGIVNIVPLGTIAAGSYTLLSYAALSGTSTGSLLFANSTSTETLNGATLTLSSGATAETLTVTVPGTVPGTAYFQGNIDGSWTSTDGSGNTNFTSDSAGTTNTLALPGVGSNVHFAATNANTANFQTTLNQNFTITTLTLDGGTITNDVGIAGGGGTLTITPSSATSGITINSGAGALTISAPIALGAAQTWTNNSASTFTVSGASLAGSTYALTIGGTGPTNISAPISGTGLLTKTGTGTLTLSGANTATGGTAIQAGTLTSGIDNALSTGALTIGLSGTSGATGTSTTAALNLATFNQTVASLAALSNSATADTITVGTGKTLTINGNLTVGYDAGVAGNAVATKLALSGGGAVTINGSSVFVGIGEATANASFSNVGTLDLTGLTGPFTAKMATSFAVGGGTGIAGVAGGGNNDAGTVTFGSGNVSITTPLITIGNSNQSNAGGSSLVTLGTGTNTLTTDRLNIGLSKVSATLSFASQTPGSQGSVTIGPDVGPSGTILDIGDQTSTGTGGTILGVLDLRGHNSTINASTVTIGSNSNAANTGYAAGNLLFDTGTFNATSLSLGSKSNTGTGSNPGASSNILTLNGGTFTVSGATTLAQHTGTGSGTSGVTSTMNIAGGTYTTASILGATKNSTTNTGAATSTINVSGTGALVVGGGGTFSLATVTSGSTGTASGTLNITGGSVTTGSDITSGGGTGVSTTLTLNGGLLDLLGHNIGAASPAIGTLNFQSGTLQNVNEINGGAPLNKTTAGTLVLTGNNTYSGGTNANAGLVLANTSNPAQSATGGGAVAVNNGASLAGGLGTAAGYINSTSAVNAITVNSGGTISAGNGPSATSATGLLVATGGNPSAGSPTFTHTWNNGATYAWKLNTNNAGATQPLANGTTDAGGAGANWDMLNMTSLNLPSTGTVSVNIVPVSGAGTNAFNPGGAYQWTIADITGTVSAPGIYQGGAAVSQGNYASLVANTLVLNTTAITTAFPAANSSSFSLSLISDGTTNGEDLVVNYAPAPEPTSLALMGLAASGLLMRRRRRRA